MIASGGDTGSSSPGNSAHGSSGGKGLAAPIALDADGDGSINYLGTHAGVTHDYNHDGHSVATAWVGPKDGLLAYEQDTGTLKIVFSTAAGQTDLQGLAQTNDTNHDGLLSSKDLNFGKFGVWVDANSDGLVETGEFKSLTASGIQSLSLTSDGNVQLGANGDVVVHGNTTFTATDGSTHLAQDVGFVTNELAHAVTEAPLDYAAIIATAQAMQSTISIDQHDPHHSSTSLTFTLDGQQFTVATAQGIEADTKGALDSILDGSHQAHPTGAANSWTEVVDISSQNGGPASVLAEGSATVENGIHDAKGDWTVIIKSGNATVDTANQQIVFSSDHANNSATIVTADGSAHNIENVDKIHWHG